MNFAPDTFESVYRRKKLAAWLATLKGPAKKRPDYSHIQNAYCGGSGGAACIPFIYSALGGIGGWAKP